LAISATIAFFGCVTLARKVPRIFSILMFASGLALTYAKGQGMGAVAEGITINLSLLTHLYWMVLSFH
jgi:hypothetical protein